MCGKPQCALVVVVLLRLRAGRWGRALLTRYGDDDVPGPSQGNRCLEAKAKTVRSLGVMTTTLVVAVGDAMAR